MRALVQRVDSASVWVNDEIVSSISGAGLLVLVGVTHTDTDRIARQLASKTYDLRAFEPRHARQPDELKSAARELSARDLSLPLLVVSQFTLYADTRKGRRPTWAAAAGRDVAEPLVETYVAALREFGAEVGIGIFGADMSVALTNDGPFTLLLEV
jgi:D-tyrosyl-tRNA(Tyr) deacylase